ncbi:MAG: hypothetical protein J6D03_01265 [Clostridia bacterium]|nr:hypothetical protein [Clostridia bacterium]
MYIHFNNNPQYDPKSSSWPKGDCVIRAVSCAMKWTWNQSYEYCVLHSSYVGDLPNTQEGFRRIMEDLHFERTVLDEKYKINVEDFCKEHNDAIYILSVEGMSGHVVCSIYGDWYDAFDSSKFRVYGYNKLTYRPPYIRKLPLLLAIRLSIRKFFRKKFKKY